MNSTAQQKPFPVRRVLIVGGMMAVFMGGYWVMALGEGPVETGGTVPRTLAVRVADPVVRPDLRRAGSGAADKGTKPPPAIPDGFPLDPEKVFGTGCFAAFQKGGTEFSYGLLLDWLGIAGNPAKVKEVNKALKDCIGYVAASEAERARVVSSYIGSYVEIGAPKDAAQVIERMTARFREAVTPEQADLLTEILQESWGFKSLSNVQMRVFIEPSEENEGQWKLVLQWVEERPEGWDVPPSTVKSPLDEEYFRLRYPYITQHLPAGAGAGK